MSEAFKCDKCGNLFEPHQGDGEVTVWQCEKQVDPEDRSGHEWTWQFCAGCMTRLFDFLPK